MDEVGGWMNGHMDEVDRWMDRWMCWWIEEQIVLEDNAFSGI